MNRISSIALIFVFLTAAYVSAAIQTEDVSYKSDGVSLKGFLAYDDASKGKRPGILIVHEWWGLNDYVKKRARMLAELGYTALALDMYGDGKTTTHPDEAGKFSGEVLQNMDEARKRFLAALEILKAHKSINPEKIAAIGYCFGGAVVLEMARQGLDLDGVASFHGDLETKNPAKPGSIKAKILVCHGEDDSFITPEAVDKFKKEMKDAGADMQFISYPGSKHSFTNPDADEMGKKAKIPIEYNAEADKKSWADMLAFLKKVFS